MKCVLAVLLASMVATVNSCKFGNEAIQGMYDRAEVFRKTKVFDTTKRTVPLVQHYEYFYSENPDGTKNLFIEINDEMMSETYKNNAANEIETISGRYVVDGKYELALLRDAKGEMIFEGQNVAFNFTLTSIYAELPNNAREEDKRVLRVFKTMRQKMFDFQKSLSKDELERVESFYYTLDPDGHFYLLYTENGGGDISVSSMEIDGKETISGIKHCIEKNQKYDVVDGKVAVDGEPVSY